MHLINYRFRQRMPRRPVIVPIEGGIDDHALRDALGIVALIPHKILIRVFDGMTEHFRPPLYLAHRGLGIGVHQHLRRIEALSV